MGRRTRLTDTPTSAGAGVVTTTKPDPEVWRKARELAGKDHSRLVILSPTEVLVLRPSS